MALINEINSNSLKALEIFKDHPDLLGSGEEAKGAYKLGKAKSDTMMQNEELKQKLWLMADKEKNTTKIKFLLHQRMEYTPDEILEQLTLQNAKTSKADFFKVAYDSNKSDDRIRITKEIVDLYLKYRSDPIDNSSKRKLEFSSPYSFGDCLIINYYLENIASTLLEKPLISYRVGDPTHENKNVGKFPAFDIQNVNSPTSDKIAGKGLYSAPDCVNTARFRDQNKNLYEIETPINAPFFDYYTWYLNNYNSYPQVEYKSSWGSIVQDIRIDGISYEMSISNILTAVENYNPRITFQYLSTKHGVKHKYIINKNPFATIVRECSQIESPPLSFFKTSCQDNNRISLINQDGDVCNQITPLDFKGKSLYHELKEITKNFNVVLSENDPMDKMINDVNHDPYLRTLFSKEAGVWEGYTVGQHTDMVLERFYNERNYSFPKVEKALKSKNIDQKAYQRLQKLFTCSLVLHDIGKGLGESKFQHENIKPILEAYLKKWGFTDSEIKLAWSLVAP